MWAIVPTLSIQLRSPPAETGRSRVQLEPLFLRQLMCALRKYQQRETRQMTAKTVPEGAPLL